MAPVFRVQGSQVRREAVSRQYLSGLLTGTQGHTLCSLPGMGQQWLNLEAVLAG